MKSLFQKHSYILWCGMFMLIYLVYTYCMTHFVLSSAYVVYLTASMELVSKGVVNYLLGSFAFFMVCILVEAGITSTLLWLLRKGLVRLSSTLVDRENVFRFAMICNLLLNFFIAVGFVFLLGIKDNFFEMYYYLFEVGKSEESVIVERMAYDVEMNWIFCDVLVLKMIFEALFSESSLKKLLPEKKEAPAEDAVEEEALLV